MAVNFFLKDPKAEETLIFCIVRYAGQRYKFSTWESIPVKAWNTERHICREIREFKLAAMVNDRLRTWREIVEDVVEDFKSKMIVPTDRQFKAAIQTEINRRSGQVDERSMSFTEWSSAFIGKADKKPSTIIAYQARLNRIIEYEKENGIKLKFSDIDMDFYRDFHRWADERKYSRNYFGSLIKQVKVFMEESYHIHNLTGHRHSKFTTEREEIKSIYLSEEELIRIHRTMITTAAISKLALEEVPGNIGQFIRTLEDARDRFLVGAFTGLRFSDYGDITDLSSDQDTLAIWTRKTDQRVVIPMHWIIKEILQRRDGVLPKPISNQRLNGLLKIVGRLAGIDELVDVSQTRGGKRKTEKILKWKLITTHTARRSAATNMYLAGIDTLSIMMITGHKTEKAFLLYIGVTPEENAERLKGHRFFIGREAEIG